MPLASDKSLSKDIYEFISESQRSMLSTLSHNEKTMLAGGIAGCVAKTITAPLSRLTILFQVGPLLSVSNNNNNLINSNNISSNGSNVSNITSNGCVNSANKYSGSLYSASSKILKEEGFLSFWKGNLTSVIHRFPYSAINFTVYDTLRSVLRDLNHSETPFTRFVCGASAGGTACFACYPLDLVRTRLTVMTNDMKASQNGKSFGGILPTMFKIVEKEGLFGLYRGVLVSVCISGPTFGISFCIYGTIKEKLMSLPSSKYNIFNCSGKLSTYGSMLCGAMSGITSSLIMFPADSIRRRMQVSGFLFQKNNINNTLNGTINGYVNGTMNNYIGHNIGKNINSSINSSIHDILTTSINLSKSVSNNMKDMNHSDEIKLRNRLTDFNKLHIEIRTLLQTKNIGNIRINADSIRMFSQGYRGLYRGIVPELLKVTPTVGIIFSVYEFTYELLNR